MDIIKAERPQKQKKFRKSKSKSKNKPKQDKKIKSAFDALCVKHQEFVVNYIANFGNGAKTWQIVHPECTNYNSACTSSSRLLRNVKVKAAIDERYSQLWKEKDSETEKSITYQLIKGLGSVDLSDIVDITTGDLIVNDLKALPPEARAAIQEIEHTEVETKFGVNKKYRIKLAPKLQALEMRAKIQKILDTKSEISFDVTVIPAKRPEKQKEQDNE